MAKRNYSESEAWTIFFGGLVIGVVLTSIFWAYAAGSKLSGNIDKESLQEINASFTESPDEFIDFCRKIRGKPEWDNTGFKRCVLKDYDQKNLIVMNVLCKKYGLNLTYGSFGVMCE